MVVVAVVASADHQENQKPHLFSQPHSEIADLLSDLLRAEDTRRSARKRLRPNEIEQLRHLQ